MPDREKVIKKLEECLSASCRGFRTCPYSDDDWDAVREALALLKEQEATEYVDDGLDSVNGKIATRYRCKFCGQTMTCEFEKSPKKFVTYCIRCGRKVLWNA